ncbi:unnamed protein product [Linum trigynum]|uniref:Uncharacterized protein n=1 Tax=Linum trigynum TaxID=586398 RepID=A0AAV2DCM9_9ROSI
MMALKRISISSLKAWLLMILLFVSMLLLANNSHHQNQVAAERPLMDGRLMMMMEMKTKARRNRILRVSSRSDDPHNGNYVSPIHKR